MPSFQLKMDRARKHLKALDKAVVGWLKINADAVVEERDPHTGDYLVTIEPRDVADNIGLIAADCVHNMRASLDQLAYALAWTNTAGPLSEKVAKHSEFPVYRLRAPTATELRKRIGVIHPDAQAVIKKLQPYHRGNPAYESDELWVLDQLWNLDKHRTLPLVTFQNGGATISGDMPINLQGGVRFAGAGPIRRKTELLRYGSRGPSHKMDMKSVFHREIALGEGTPAPGEPVVPLLTRLADYVEDMILIQLGPFLD